MDDSPCGIPEHDEGFWVSDDIYYCSECRNEFHFEPNKE